MREYFRETREKSEKDMEEDTAKDTAKKVEGENIDFRTNMADMEKMIRCFR